MSGEAGGWMWFAMNVGLVVLLGVALGYGMWTWRTNRRSPRMDRFRDKKTEELHNRRDPDDAPPRGRGVNRSVEALSQARAVEQGSAETEIVSQGCAVAGHRAAALLNDPRFA